MLTPLHLIFFAFAAIAAGSALFVITARNAVHSVLSLVVTFFAMAGVWMILHAEFLSLILLLVYVGAVMTLFLFVVMMLNLDREEKKRSFVRYLPIGLLIVLLMVGLMMVAVGPSYFGLEQMPAPVMAADYNNLQQLGEVLYTDYVYPFEIGGALLLTAMIAAIALAFRGPHRRKVQHPSQQIAVRPEDRLRIISMPPSSKPSQPKEGE